jgi:transcriptional regulator with XRE-family HTH domain
MQPQDLGRRLRIARDAAGLTQSQVAAALGFSGHTIANWEAERTTPSLADVAALSVLYRVRVGWLVLAESVDPVTCPHSVPLRDRCTDCEVRR